MNCLVENTVISQAKLRNTWSPTQQELAAESRTTFDDKTNTMNLNKKKVTDYRRNSRVVHPRAQSGAKESNLEENCKRATNTG